MGGTSSSFSLYPGVNQESTNSISGTIDQTVDIQVEYTQSCSVESSSSQEVIIDGCTLYGNVTLTAGTELYAGCTMTASTALSVSQQSYQQAINIAAQSVDPLSCSASECAGVGCASASSGGLTGALAGATGMVSCDLPQMINMVSTQRVSVAIDQETVANVEYNQECSMQQAQEQTLQCSNSTVWGAISFSSFANSTLACTQNASTTVSVYQDATQDMQNESSQDVVNSGGSMLGILLLLIFFILLIIIMAAVGSKSNEGDARASASSLTDEDRRVLNEYARSLASTPSASSVPVRAGGPSSEEVSVYFSDDDLRVVQSSIAARNQVTGYYGQKGFDGRTMQQSTLDKVPFSSGAVLVVSLANIAAYAICYNLALPPMPSPYESPASLEEFNNARVVWGSVSLALLATGIGLLTAELVMIDDPLYGVAWHSLAQRRAESKGRYQESLSQTKAEVMQRLGASS